MFRFQGWNFFRLALALVALTITTGGEAHGAAGPAAWSHLTHTAPWTRAVHAVVVRNFAKLNQARDKEYFCPGYNEASQDQKETCWVRLVSAVTRFESDFNPRTAFREPNGHWSVGLLQLSPGECRNANSVEELKGAVNNLLCGTERMAALIERYGYITTPNNLQGAAAYWSTLRAPYTAHGYRLGKKLEIAKITALYRAVNPVSSEYFLAEEAQAVEQAEGEM